jgi:hypothetical protein
MLSLAFVSDDGRSTMRLKYKPFDARARHYVNINDEDTGEEVGCIQTYGVGPDRFGGIIVSLFGGRYEISVNRSEECLGFVKGVETVLNHMISSVPIQPWRPAPKTTPIQKRSPATETAAPRRVLANK